MACSTEMGLPSASRMRTRSITRSPAGSRSACAAASSAADSRALITRVPATTPWLRSSAGTPTTRERSRSNLALADEGAAATARYPAHHAVVRQHGEGLPQGGPADAQLRGERPLGAQPLAGTQLPGRDLADEDAAHIFGGAAGFASGHQPSSASSDSGSTWPPSTTMVCPVM
jgi:hypothetical protein